MEINGYTIPEAFASAFQHSVQLYPCKEYDPTTSLLVIPGDLSNGTETVCYLPLDAKRLWFELWCRENGKFPKIFTSCEDIRFDVFANNNTRYGIAKGKAEVYADDVLLSSFTAVQQFSIDDFAAVNNIVQSVQGLALTKALTNAGFGALPSSKVEDKGPDYVPSGFPAVTFNGIPIGSAQFPTVTLPGNNETVSNNPPVVNPPVVPPVPKVSAPPVPNASSPAITSGENNAQAVGVVETRNRVTDPKKAAKTLICPLNGKNKGKTLGEVLLTDPKAIEYMADSTRINDEQIKAAARLLLNDALTAMGKPLRPNA